MITVLNLTAETESSFDSELDDVVIRLEGHEIWRDKEVWDRYGGSGIHEAVEDFAARLREVLKEART